jgi:phosphatidylglycerol---prolipoprotein diacylglyceryl transferase
MLVFPHINPIAIHFGSLHIYWYGLMYLFGFGIAFLIAKYRIKHYQIKFSNAELSDLIFYCALGTIIGGRIGYMLFYNLPNFLSNPVIILWFWEGGMSFHGGLLGVILGLYFYAKKVKKSFFIVTDFTAPLVPIGIFLGRIGNFINGELWGRITTMPWGIIYPNAGPLPRHPSELYEAFFEGIVLLFIIWFYAKKFRPTGFISAIFLISYGIMRVFLEFFREPDSQLGFIAFNWLTMGQILSLLMILAGIVILALHHKLNNK